MGSPVVSLKQLQRVLQEEPEGIVWSKVRQTILTRGHSGLGFKLHTVQGKSESFSIVTKVKEDCHIKDGSLKVFDRIVAINCYEIIQDSEQFILKCLRTASQSQILLNVCSPKDLKSSASTLAVKHTVDNGDSCEDLSEAKTCVTDDVLAQQTEEDLDIEENKQVRSVFPNTYIDKNKNVVFTQKSRGDSERKQSENLEHSQLQSTEAHLFADEVQASSGLNPRLEVDGSSRNFKRGISQVSKSSSIQTMSGSALLPHRRTGGKPKADSKAVKKFFKTGSTDSPDREEMEPLHQKESKVDSKHQNYFIIEERNSSLPGPFKDRAVSMADIVLDPDQAHSLPDGDFRPSSCHTNCQCASCLGGSAVCNHCGVRPASTPRKSHNVPAVSFTEIPPGQLPEEYGAFLLKNPHLAVWDGKNTHVVEIDKGSAKEFGFSYKVKIGKNQDTSVEIYTLVQSVEKGGPAKGKVHVGDWIRSVNGTPIQIPADAFNLINNSNKERLLRLVIQRPIGLSQQPLLLRTEVHDNPADMKPPSPQPPSLSPLARDIDPLVSSVHIPGIIEPERESEPKVTTQNIYFQDTPTTSNEELDMVNPPFPRAVKLPKVRVFICGGEAEKCAKFLLKDSDIGLDFKRPGYTCADCSMATDCFGNVVISVPCSNLYNTSNQPSSYAMKSGGDARCRHCGNDCLSGGSQVAFGTVVNIELFVIPDDRLFLHCSNYLFTKSSIFILTFDGAKLLGSTPGEFARLQNLSHTIRSFVGDEAHIMSCGLLDQSVHTKNFIDEVRALFYTPYNTQLQNFNVFGPELINLNKNATSAEGFRDSNQLHVILWKVITETIQRQRVLHPALLIIDQLNMIRKKDMFVTEAQLMDTIRHKLPNFQLDIHQMILTYLIMNKEILLGKAMPFFMSHHSSIESQVLLDPRVLMDHLHNVICTISEDKQIWNRTHSTGFIKSSQFLDLLLEAGAQKQPLLEFLECCGLTFKKTVQSGDNLVYDLFLPYFALLPSSSVSPVADKKDWVLYLKFMDHEPTQIYFQLILGLIAQTDSPGSLSVTDVHCCTFMHQGLLITVHHQKVEDRVKFIFRREDKSGGPKPSELLEWLLKASHKALDPADVDFQLGAPCPHGEECRRGTSQGFHLVNVKQAKVQLYCGEDRIDHIKSIRMWRGRDTESINLPPVKSSVGGLGLTPIKSPNPSRKPVQVMELGWSVFHRICLKLKVHSPLGNDWQGLAGLMGYTTEDVQLYETSADPPKQLLCDWSRTNNATIEDLIKLLHELDRKDIVSDIQHQVPGLVSSNMEQEPSIEPRQGVSGVPKDSGPIEEPVTQHMTPGILLRNVTSTSQMSEEDNCVGLGQSVVYNNLESYTQRDSLAAGTAHTITPVEIIYQKSNSLQES